jgi:16S rRNA (guanine527-N7)-methyltransferase
VPKTPDILDPASRIGVAARQLVGENLTNYPDFFVSIEFLERIERFATELARWGTKLNLTAAPNDPVQLAFHILDSLSSLLLASRDSTGMLAKAFGPAQRILDLGSGAGFPGLILAAATEAEFVLAEARRKRASFLNIVAAAMQLDKVLVDNRHRTVFTPEFDVVTARAFARPALFYEVAAPALKPGGTLVLYASLRQKPEIEDALNRRGEAWTAYEYAPPRLSGSISSVSGSPHLIVVSRVTR